VNVLGNAEIAPKQDDGNIYIDPGNYGDVVSLLKNGQIAYYHGDDGEGAGSWYTWYDFTNNKLNKKDELIFTSDLVDEATWTWQSTWTLNGKTITEQAANTKRNVTMMPTTGVSITKIN